MNRRIVFLELLLCLSQYVMLEWRVAFELTSEPGQRSDAFRNQRIIFRDFPHHQLVVPQRRMSHRA